MSLSAVVRLACAHMGDKCCSCGQPDVPYQESQISAPVITKLLQKSGTLPANAVIQDLKHKKFGVGEGLASDMYRLTISYGPNADASWPTSLVCKFGPTGLGVKILMDVVLNLFLKEHLFYERNMPNATGMPAPKCYFSSYGGYARTCILLEDLAPARPGDQITGVSAEDMKTGLLALAQMHAKFYNKVGASPETKDWPGRQQNVGFKTMCKKLFCDTREEFCGEALLAKLNLTPADIPNVLEFVQFFTDDQYETFLKNDMNDYKELNARSQFGTTLCHGDFRTDNVFFKCNDGKLRIIDFQLVREDHPSNDVNYGFYTSMKTEVRREHEMALIEAYVTEMRRLGADLGMDEFLVSFQKTIVVGIVAQVIAAKSVDTGSERGTQLFQETFLRLDALVGDWKVLGAFKMMVQKMDADGVRSKYTDEELRSTLPDGAWRLVEKHRQQGSGLPEAVQGA